MTVTMQSVCGDGFNLASAGNGGGCVLEQGFDTRNLLNL